MGRQTMGLVGLGLFHLDQGAHSIPARPHQQQREQGHRGEDGQEHIPEASGYKRRP